MTPSAFHNVRVGIGKDGKAYYTPHYANGKKGPRSQGYVVHDGDGAIDEAASLASACKAAARDFPDLVQEVSVDTQGD